MKCTDQLNYAGDPRSNAEINSIGEETGTCPPVQDK
ncbi:Secreted protein OS=Streptomyces tendae OX=1932 GN=GUR47_26505 PE=4 SV=1 [Streptomyces tendae]